MDKDTYRIEDTEEFISKKVKQKVMIADPEFVKEAIHHYLMTKNIGYVDHSRIRFIVKNDYPYGVKKGSTFFTTKLSFEGARIVLEEEEIE